MTDNNNNYLSKYKELLQIGRNKLNGTIENDVELHLLNDEKRFEEMLELNKYVYTYYSTNKSDLTQSIEFIILTDVVDEFIEKLKEKGYWYIYKKYNDNEAVMRLGAEHNKTIPEIRTITGEELDMFRIKSSNNPYGWKITKKTNTYINIERITPVHFLCKDMLECLLETYNRNSLDDYFDDGSFIELYPHLTVITIENPLICKTNLYSTLIDIVEPLLEHILYST